MSTILGKVSPAEAHRRVRMTGEPSRYDGVRYALVGDLRALGFVITHDPRPGNTKHVSVSYPGEWDDSVAGKFNQCFSVPFWHGKPEGRSK